VPVLSLTVDCVREVVWPLIEEVEEEKVCEVYDEGIVSVLRSRSGIGVSKS
jgi:hypothetical protein